MKRTRRSSHGWFLLLPPLFAGHVVAAEGPNVLVGVQNTINIYTATPAVSNVPGFKPHINFPTLKARADGSLNVDFTVGQTHGSGAFGMDAYSYDGGLTWTGFTTVGPSVPNEQLVKPVGQTSYGISSAMSSASGTNNWVNTLYTTTSGGTNWSYSNAYFNTGAVSYINAYNDVTDIQQYGSTLLGTMYAQRVGQTTYESVLFASTDNGVNWNRRSTIASYTSDLNVQMGSEGPTEGSILQLNNGNLLSVYRTGQVFPSSSINATGPTICWSMSTDQGNTWTSPKQLGVGGDFPQLRKLDDGTVAMTYGRYGAKVMFADATGTRWGTPTVIYNGPGSGYVDMRKTANGTYCFVYDQSSFYPPSYDGNPPSAYVYNNDQSANLKAAILNITPQATTDDFHWANEYHGDYSPETLPQPWTKGQSGAVVNRQWAELGQDYIRVSTAGGGSNLLYYQLPSAGTAWGGIDFTQGAVIDMRGRCSLSTAEGSADTLFDDGSHGFGVLQLTGTGVILEGQGGNASQVSYLTAAHPGFNIFDWHNYRVVVEPDPSAGGAIMAKVYLDGNYSTPILTKTLAPSSAGLIRFGDETGTNNGNFDMDFLRFSALNGQWNVDADGNWNGFGNWSATVPGGINRTASFLGTATAPRTATVTSPVTIGHILFNNQNGYTIAGNAAITLQVSGGQADVSVAAGNHRIDAPVTLASNTTFSIVPLTSTLTIGGALSATNATLTKTGAGILAIRNIRASGIVVDTGTVRVLANGTTSGTSNVGSLAISPGASLDLLDNDLVVRSGNVGSWSGLSYTGLSGLIASGRGDGTWNGTGLLTSMPGATQAGLTTLALGKAVDVLGISSVDSAVWSGQIVAGADVLVMYTYAGDANLDGVIDLSDYGYIDFNVGGEGYGNGDFNFDGVIDLSDYGVIDFNVGSQGAPLGASSIADTLPIPEPAFGLAGAAALLMFRRRARRA